MKSHKEIEDFLLAQPDTWIDFPFDADTSVYKVGHDNDGKGKIFAIIADKTNPLKISLKCDPLLAERLRETYETVMPGYHLNKKHWNTILCTGQVPDDELKSLILHSYDLVAKESDS